MSAKLVLTIGGTRPELIKLAPVVRELARRKDKFVSRICVTGQHRQLLDQVLELFGIVPDHDLALMTSDQNLSSLTARMVNGLATIMAEEVPALVIVQGDTTTAFCGALAAYYQQIPVAHVEAGLRTGQKYAPFPEELNRRLVAQIADVHFAPTAKARDALRAEGVPEPSIHVTGNTVIDALLWVRTQIAQREPQLPHSLREALADFPVLLVTAHRRESIDATLEAICQAIGDVLTAHSSVRVVFPMHLNPRVRRVIERDLRNRQRVFLLEPQHYAAFVWLLDRATVVLTDSGGVQEEAPSLGTPVLVARDTTERPEGVIAGNARVVGTSRTVIAKNVIALLTQPEVRNAMTQRGNPYGDGSAATQIVDVLSASVLT